MKAVVLSVQDYLLYATELNEVRALWIFRCVH